MKSSLFAMQFDDSTGISMSSELMVFAWFMINGVFKELVFRKTLGTTTKIQDVYGIVNNSKLNWKKKKEVDVISDVRSKICFQAW